MGSFNAFPENRPGHIRGVQAAENQESAVSGIHVIQ